MYSMVAASLTRQGQEGKLVAGVRKCFFPCHSRKYDILGRGADNHHREQPPFRKEARAHLEVCGDQSPTEGRHRNAASCLRKR